MSRLWAPTWAIFSYERSPRQWYRLRNGNVYLDTYVELRHEYVGLTKGHATGQNPRSKPGRYCV